MRLKHLRKKISGPTKVVNVFTYIQTKHTIVGPVKKLNCLSELSKPNCLNGIGLKTKLSI